MKLDVQIIIVSCTVRKLVCAAKAIIYSVVYSVIEVHRAKVSCML